MIRPLRQRHRVMVCALGIVLPVAFALGIGARRAVPEAMSLPAELFQSTSEIGPEVWTRTDLWPGHDIVTRLRRGSTNAVALELTIADMAKPDVLVYWVAGEQAANGKLPDEARLLGALQNRSWLPLNAEMRTEVGRLVLYSLADQVVVAVSGAFRIDEE